MPIPLTLFAALLGIAAPVALVAAVRAWRRGGSAHVRANGLLLFAVASAVQVVNLFLGYSWLISVLTMAGMFAGLWMGLPRPRDL
jgi:hypothetical protein